MLGLKETIDQLATANGVRWYGYDDSVLRVVLDLKVSGKRKQRRLKKGGRSKWRRRRQKIGVKKEDTLNRTKWRDGVQAIAEGIG